MANLTATTITGNLDVDGGGVITGDGSGLTGVDPFASGTKMVFYQASAPTGWTQDTAAALSDAAFRVTTGTGAGTGGSDTFQTTFGSSRSTETKSLPVSGSVSGTVGNTTLSTPQISAHSHSLTGTDGAFSNHGHGNFNQVASGSTQGPGISTQGISTSTSSGGGNHTHPFSGNLSSANAPNASFAIPGMNIKYANVIVAAKD